MTATRRRPAGAAAIPIDRRVLRLDRHASTLLYIAVALAVLSSALLIITSWLLSEIIARIFLGDQHLWNVLPFLGAMFILAILRAGLIWNSRVVSQHAASCLKDTTRAQLSDKLYTLGPAHIHRERSGELVHTLVEGVEALDEYISEYQPARLLTGLIPVLILAFILLLDPLTALVLLFAGPMLVLLLAVIGARTRDLSRQRFRDMGWMSSHFLDMVQGLATLKLFGRSHEQVEIIEDVSQQFAKSTMRVLRTAFQTSLVLEWASVGATAFVALEVSLRLMHGTIPFDRALTVLLLTPEFFLPLRQLALKYHAGATGKAAAERIFALLDTAPVSSKAARPPATAESTAPSMPGRNGATRSGRFDVYLKDVHFCYDDRSQPALQGITLAIPHSKITALVGPTGAGKTTLAKLLLRFIEPSSGTIRIGDLPLSNFDPATSRSLVSWVPQHPYFFHGTITDNIQLARPDAGMDEIISAARAAHAHEFIEALPEGYETQVYEHGMRLSGGQRQRIAIARAFLKGAPFLILDEATAHLDAESEALVKQSLLELMRGRTTLIIAHRLDMAYGADQIAVMDQGRVVEVGTHHTLLAAATLYRRLFATSRETVA
jgi:ATP-binding cassette, subfamily C, bacterial CydD